MASSASVSTGQEDPGDRLRHARSVVIAGLTDSATGAPRPVVSATPIRTLPSSVAAVVAARSDAGLLPAGEFFPRRTALRRVAVPSSTVAGLAVVVGVVALINDLDAALLVALCSILVLTGIAAATTRWAHADPLRLDPAGRLVVEAASRWAPGTSRTASGPARALVAFAASAAQRIVDSPAWRSGTLAHSGVVVALATELDLAEQRATHARDEDWARLVTRVSALVAYADTVTRLEAGTLDPAEVEVLAFLLSSAIYNVG